MSTRDNFNGKAELPSDVDEALVLQALQTMQGDQTKFFEKGELISDDLIESQREDLEKATNEALAAMTPVLAYLHEQGFISQEKQPVGPFKVLMSKITDEGIAHLEQKLSMSSQELTAGSEPNPS